MDSSVLASHPVLTAAISAASVTLAAGGIGTFALAGGEPGSKPRAAVSPWSREAHPTIGAQAGGACVAAVAEVQAAKPTLSRIVFGTRAPLGLRVSGSERTSQHKCNALLRIGLERPERLLADELQVTIHYWLAHRSGWFNARIAGSLACSDAELRRSDRDACQRWYDTPGARNGSYTLQLILPADQIRLRGELALALSLSAVSRGGSGDLMVEMIEMEPVP